MKMTRTLIGATGLLLAVAVAGCNSGEKKAASPGVVGGEKAACCAEGKAKTDACCAEGTAAKKASPGVIGGKTDSCTSGKTCESGAASCTDKK